MLLTDHLLHNPHLKAKAAGHNCAVDGLHKYFLIVDDDVIVGVGMDVQEVIFLFVILDDAGLQSVLENSKVRHIEFQVAALVAFRWDFKDIVPIHNDPVDEDLEGSIG